METSPFGFRPGTVAKMLDCSRTTVWRLCKEHELEALRLSRHTVIITKKSIDALFERRRAAAAAGAQA